MVEIMTKRTLSALTVALFGLLLTFSVVGTATAGDGKSCGDKKKGESAATLVQELPAA
jgi:hypothetical protein